MSRIAKLSSATGVNVDRIQDKSEQVCHSLLCLVAQQIVCRVWQSPSCKLVPGVAVPTVQAAPLFNICLDKLSILTSGIWIILYISCL
jgi:hypothetical protein